MKYTVKELGGTCRICKSKNIDCFLELDDMPFTDDFIRQDPAGTEFLYPIKVFFCGDCYTVQTQHDVMVDTYYEDYQYSVGASAFAAAFMNSLAQKLLQNYFNSKSDISVLEIGSGDGGQLVPFKEMGCEVLGYEPSTFLVDVAAKKGIPSIQGLFDGDAVEKLPIRFRKANIILLSYTFDHIPDPAGFLETVSKILDPENGILVIENHDLQQIFERREYCLFEHEHSIYLTRETALDMANRFGYDLLEFDVLPELERRANSLIFVMAKKGSVHSSRAIKEHVLGAYRQREFYIRQGADIQAGITRFDKYILEKTAAGKKLAGYGAGGRGVMTLAALPHAHLLTCLVDMKPKSGGILAPKSHLPVYPVSHLQTERVDEIIVFSFGYMNEIKATLVKMGYQEENIISMLDILK